MSFHGYFSPSQLQLRYSCPGSVALEKQLPEGTEHTSAAATLGTKKHKMCEDIRAGVISADSPDVPEDVSFCIVAVDTILNGLPADVTIVNEYQVDLKYLGIDQTADGCRVDFLAIIPGSFAVVVDYKFGVMVTDSPRYNLQLRAYCAGVARAFGLAEVEAVILQPNCDDEYKFRAFTFKADELVETEATIKKIIEVAGASDAPLIRGEHCTEGFCKCKKTCPKWRDAFLCLPEHTPVVDFMRGLSPMKRAELYENLLAASKFCEKAVEAVKETAISGLLEIEGYEVGPGKMSREWIDPIFAASELCTLAIVKGLSSVDVLVPLSPAKAEKLLGKNVVAPMITSTPSPNPVLKKSK